MATLVVGASGGIGQAIVQRLRNHGHEVVEMSRSAGVDCLDLGAVQRFLSDKPPIDCLSHVAGSVGKGGIEDQTVAEWRRVMDDNVTTALVACQAVAPGMKEAGRGAIVLMSSVNGRSGGNRLSGPAYASAKAAIFGLTKHLALDLAPAVRVNCVAPGPVATPMLDRLTEAEMNGLLAKIPLKRITPADEIAAAVEFLLSGEAASITGVTLDVNGGQWMG